MWECPLLAPLPLHPAVPAPGGAPAAEQLPGSRPRPSGQHLLAACQDYCANIPAVWLGRYRSVGGWL